MSDNIARQMAAAPATRRTPATTTAPKAKVNPFDALYPPSGAVFRSNVRQPDKPWSNGTVSQTVADVVIPLNGIDGAYLDNIRIVWLTLPGGQGKRLALQMPTSGQQYRRPMHGFDGDNSESARNLFEAWKNSVVAGFIAWRTDQVKNGAPTITGATYDGGISADADLLAALGLGAEVLSNGKARGTTTPEPAAPTTTT